MDPELKEFPPQLSSTQCKCELCTTTKKGIHCLQALSVCFRHGYLTTNTLLVTWLLVLVGETAVFCVYLRIIQRALLAIFHIEMIHCV